MSRTRTRSRKRTTPAAHPEPHLRPVPPTGTRPGINLTKRPAPATATATATEPALYGDLRANAATATFAAGSLGIPAYFHTWTGMSTGEATCLLNPDEQDSIRLVYDRHPNQLSATQKCRHGQWHAAPIDTASDIDTFEQAVAGCEHHNPRALRAQALGQGIHRATTAALPTEQTDVLSLREAHAADNDQPKEHPAS